MDQFADFLRALGQVESGGNYQVVQKTSGALGKYQIMPANWKAWSTAVFGEVADWRDPDAQEAVAQHVLRGYWDRYRDWRLVAIAWFAGPSRADKAKTQGISSVAGIKDSIGTSVAQYVQKVVGQMDPTLPSITPQVVDVDQTPIDYTEAMTQMGQQPKPSFRDTFIGLLDGMSSVIAGGQRTLPPTLGTGEVQELEAKTERTVENIQEPY